MTATEAAAYNYVRRGIARTRAELARVMCVSRPTASTVTESLISSGLLCDGGKCRSAGGRSPTLLIPRTEAFSLIGVDVGCCGRLAGVLVNALGDVIGSVDAAAAVLEQIPLRNAEWCFLYGMCCYRSGHYARAYEYVTRAVQMEPDNAEYRNALASMRGASSATRSWTQRGGDYSLCTTCGSIICANMLCSLCCRGG